MGNFISEYKKPAISAVVFFVTLATLSYSYAAFVALTDVTSGQTLTKDAWNLMVADLNDLNSRAVPTGAVMAFFGTSCPTNWSPADGAANGVKKTDGTSGTLDLRGEFIRGLDAAGVGARNVDPGRTIGTSQGATQLLVDNDQNENVGAIDWTNNNLSNLGYETSTFAGNVSLHYNTTTNVSTTSNSFLRSARPRNVALLYCVKN